MDEAYFENHQKETYNVIQMAFQFAGRSVAESGIDSDCLTSFGSCPLSSEPELDRSACRFPGQGTFPQTQTSQPDGRGDEDISSLPELSPEVISQLDEFLDNFFIPPIEPKDDDSPTSSKNVDRLSEAQLGKASTTFGREKFVTYIEWESIAQNTRASPIQDETTEKTQNTKDELKYPEKTTVHNQSPMKESREVAPCLEVSKEVNQRVSKNTEENPRIHGQSDSTNASTCGEDSAIDFKSLAHYLETADDYALGVDILSEFNKELSTATDLTETTMSENNNSYSFVTEPLSCGSSQVSWSALEEPQSYSAERRLASTPVCSGDESSGYLSASDIEFSNCMLHINSQPVSPIQSPSTPSTPRYSEAHSSCSAEAKENQDKEEENKKKSDKQKKPAETYVSMIAKAMLANGLQRMSLTDLYTKIEELFPYYKTSTITWRNAVRHNLSINECFVKAGRADSGRGFYWTIHPSCVEVFKNGKYKRREARRRVQNLTRMGTVSITPFTPITLHSYQNAPELNNYQFTLPVQMSSTAIHSQIQGLEAHADMLTRSQSGYYSTPMMTSTPSRNYLYHPYEQYYE